MYGETAAYDVSRAVLVHSLGCGFQIKGYGRRGVTDKGSYVGVVAGAIRGAGKEEKEEG